MFAYVICFCVSIVFAHLAKRSRSKINFFVFSMISIAVTVLLAGLRGISVGIDTYNYYRGRWSIAYYSASFRDYLVNYFVRSGDRVELLFALMIGAVAKTTGSFQVYLVLVHLMIVGFFYAGAFRLRRFANPVFILTLFYFLYYNHSLNISRQYIAMSILFFALDDIEKGKRKRYLIAVLAATLFHNTGFIGLLPLMVHSVLYPRKHFQNTSITRKAIVMFAIISAFYGFIPLVRLLIQANVISRHYASYILSDEAATPLIVTSLLVLEAISFLLFWRNKGPKKIQHAEFFLFMSIIFLMLYQLAGLIFYGKRVAAYFSFANIVTLGILPEIQKDAKLRFILRGLIIGAVVAYWLYFYAYQNASRTMPYILGV